MLTMRAREACVASTRKTTWLPVLRNTSLWMTRSPSGVRSTGLFCASRLTTKPSTVVPFATPASAGGMPCESRSGAEAASGRTLMVGLMAGAASGSATERYSLRSSLTEIVAASVAAVVCGALSISEDCERIASLTLLSLRMTPSRAGENFRKFVQARFMVW